LLLLSFLFTATWGVDEFFAKALAIFFNWIKTILLWQIITLKKVVCSRAVSGRISESLYRTEISRLEMEDYVSQVLVLLKR
jgi:hypothetical protein